MNTRQRIAYQRPSEEGEDTNRPEFGWLGDLDGRRLRLHLTANVGLE